MFEVNKNQIKEALKSMNREYDFMKNEVKNVVERTNHYDVFVDTTNDYPYITNSWERGEFLL